MGIKDPSIEGDGTIFRFVPILFFFFFFVISTSCVISIMYTKLLGGSAFVFVIVDQAVCVCGFGGVGGVNLCFFSL